MRKIINILATIAIIITLLTISMPIYAYTEKQEIQVENPTPNIKLAKKQHAGTMITQGDEFIKTGEKDADKAISQDSMKELSNTIYNILLVLGIILAVILGAILGIKFIIEGAEGKAEVKKALAPYIAGCVVVFGAFTIWKIVVTILQA